MLVLRDSADIRLTGPATLFGTVQRGLKMLVETLRRPVSGYEFEEFIHGIYNAFNAQSAPIMLRPAPRTRSVRDRLAQIPVSGRRLFTARPAGRKWSESEFPVCQ